MSEDTSSRSDLCSGPRFFGPTVHVCFAPDRVFVLTAVCGRRDNTNMLIALLCLLPNTISSCIVSLMQIDAEQEPDEYCWHLAYYSAETEQAQNRQAQI